MEVSLAPAVLGQKQAIINLAFQYLEDGRVHLRVFVKLQANIDPHTIFEGKPLQNGVPGGKYGHSLYSSGNLDGSKCTRLVGFTSQLSSMALLGSILVTLVVSSRQQPSVEAI